MSVRTSVYLSLLPLLVACGSPSEESVASEPSALDAPGAVAPRFEDRIVASDTIAELTVTRVDFRVSEAGPGLQQLPYTFVTFEVGETFKGELGDTVTLPFAGGVWQDGITTVFSDTPLFAVGDHDVLFLSDRYVGFPVVGDTEGRFRILDEHVVSNDGNAVVWNEEGLLKAGPLVRDERLAAFRFGNAVLPGGGLSEDALPMSESGAISADFFRAFLRDAVRTLGDLRGAPILSRDPDQALRIPAPDVRAVLPAGEIIPDALPETLPAFAPLAPKR